MAKISYASSLTAVRTGLQFVSRGHPFAVTGSCTLSTVTGSALQLSVGEGSGMSIHNWWHLVTALSHYQHVPLSVRKDIVRSK